VPARRSDTGSRPTHRRPWRGASALVTAAVLALAGCGGTQGAPQAEVSGDAPAEDELVVYSGRNKVLVDPLLRDFEARSGIKVFVRYGDSAELAAQLAEEGERTKADVFFSQDAGALGALSRAGRFDRLPPTVLDRVPAAYRAADGSWVGTSGRVRVLAYDPRQVSSGQLPDSVFDLTAPAWRDKVGFAPTNASFQAFVTGMRLIAGEDRTRQWLTGMKANRMKPYDNNVRVLEAVDRGEIAIGLINHYYWYEKVAEVGKEKVNARIAFLGDGDPGALVNVAGVGVLAGTDKQDGAGRLVDFLLTEPAQRHFAEQTAEYPLAAGVRPRADLPRLASLDSPEIDLSRLDSLQQTLDMLREVGLT
jgi:iron(III) transport system substrate-binding protein